MASTEVNAMIRFNAELFRDFSDSALRETGRK